MSNSTFISEKQAIKQNAGNVAKYVDMLLDLSRYFGCNKPEGLDYSKIDESLTDSAWLDDVRYILSTHRTLDSERLYLALRCTEDEISRSWTVRLNTMHTVIGLVSHIRKIEDIKATLVKRGQIMVEVRENATTVNNTLSNHSNLREKVIPKLWDGIVPCFDRKFMDRAEQLRDVYENVTDALAKLRECCGEILIPMFANSEASEDPAADACMNLGIIFKSETHIMDATLDNAIKLYRELCERFGDNWVSKCLSERLPNSDLLSECNTLMEETSDLSTSNEILAVLDLSLTLNATLLDQGTATDEPAGSDESVQKPIGTFGTAGEGQSTTLENQTGIEMLAELNQEQGTSK